MSADTLYNVREYLGSMLVYHIPKLGKQLFTSRNTINRHPDLA